MNKINQAFIVKIVLVVLTVCLTALAARVLIHSWQIAQATDEEILTQHNPTLQKNLIRQARETVESFHNLTAASPAANLEKEVVENENEAE
ncbi:hypothetical protein KJ965_00545 [Patescibacteria group bacterium]|nr:hypothetical protein [Patescibacteria group bacterium]